jgi:hypothetical protein
MSEGEQPQGLRAAQFAPSQEADLLQWLAREAETRNLYFSPNPLLRLPESGKARKADVKAVAWLHVDVDPRAGEDQAAERARIRRLFDEDRPEGVPPPTVVIFSGGGYQALWKLREPVPIEGDVARAEEVERHTRALEFAFGADRCHNVERILRLPGTLNRPDFKKRAKGRSEARAELVLFKAERVYDLAQFTRAPELQRSPSGIQAAKLGGGERRTSDQLPARLNDSVKAAIAHGHDPQEPGRFPSRSEWLIWVCCELIRAGCNDQLILDVITDPSFAISASVLDKKSRAEPYALRQIARAHDFVDKDPVAEINREYLSALEGRRVQFFREEPDGTLAPMNKEAFMYELAPRRALVPNGRGENIEVEAVRLWLKSPRRRYFPRGFVLDPTHGHPEGYYNLWKGFGVEPAPGDWSRMRAHVEEVLAAGDARHAEYILRWAAWSVQNPATPPKVALVFRGDEGVGKGVFCNALRQAFGAHGWRLQSMAQVAGRFNAHLRHCCLLFADEAMLPTEEHVGTLKGMITEDDLPIEGKGVDIIQAENHLHVVMSSNNDWVVPAGIGARRFAVFDVPKTRKGDREYFEALVHELKEGGLAAMLHDLLAMDLGRWHPEANRPDTAALMRQKVMSLPPLEREWFACLETGALPMGKSLGGGAVLLPTRPFVAYVADRTRREDVTPNKLQGLLGEKLGLARRIEVRPKGWEVPPLPEARRRWSERMFPWEWDAADSWDVETQVSAHEEGDRRF